MRRVSLLLDLVDDEADLVVEAVSATPVRFAGLTLSQVLEMLSQDSPSGSPDVTIVHNARSDGALYAGAPQFRLVRSE